MLSELTLVLGNDRVCRVRKCFIIKPPPRELGSRGRAGGKRDIVALPRIRLTEFDLPLREIAKRRVSEIARTGIDLPVSKGPSRACQRVDEVPALGRLVSSQNFADQALGDVGRCHRDGALGWREEGDVGVANDRDAGLGLQIQPVDILPEVELAEVRRGWTWVRRRVGAKLRWVPIRPTSIAEFVDPIRVSTHAVKRVVGEPGTARYRSRALSKRSQSLRRIGTR